MRCHRLTRSGRAATDGLGSQEPRVELIPEGVEHPDTLAALEFCDAAGFMFDPWQTRVFQKSLLRNAGKWAAFEVAACLPRQNGKNVLLEARELAGPFIFGERLLIHSAHLADTSREAFRRLEEHLEANAWLSREVRHIWRTNGHESIEFKNGSRIRFRTRTKGGGRGFSGDWLGFDEAMVFPETSLGAILPVVSARPDPQVWYMGSAVDQTIHEDGIVFSRVRHRALNGEPRLAYFEWSLEFADPAEVPPEVAASAEAQAQANPARGIRISPGHIENERRSMDPRTFAVERLGVGDWHSIDDSSGVFDMQRWAELADGKSAFAGRPTICFDVSPNRSWATICGAGLRPDGAGHVEITGRAGEIDRRRGTGWLPDRLKELYERQSPLILCDERGPAQTLVPELEKLGVKVETVNASEYAQACGLFFDAVEQGKVRHLGQPELTAALRAATTRPLGDRFAWDRKNSAADITPLVAATVAHWSAVTQSRPEPIAVWA